MGSTGKVALTTIMCIAAVTGILCYYAFNIVAPRPGEMTYVSRVPQPRTVAAPSPMPSTEGEKPENIEPNIGSVTKNDTGNVTRTNVTASTVPGSNASGPPGIPSATLKILKGASVQGNPNYDPNPVTVKVGDTIGVDNEDSAPHTVTSGKDATDPNVGKLFDTSIINAGGTAEIVTTSLKPGEYPFFCSVHPYMTGSLRMR